MLINVNIILGDRYTEGCKRRYIDKSINLALPCILEVENNNIKRG
jgi:hypothetical protein